MKRSHIATAAGLVLVAALSTGCGNGSTGSASSGSGDGGTDGGTIAFLLKENKTARWEMFDRPYFTEALSVQCPACKLLYNNAEQDSAKQQAQADAALANGAKVLVITPVDSKASAAIAQKAKAQNVPVIAYDALVQNAPIDFYVSFQNEEVGKLQGDALVKKLTDDGTITKGQIVIINGAPTDANAAQFKKGAHTALDGKVTVGREYDTPDWSPDKAQTQMQQAITALGKDNIVGVYAANDGTAGGAVAAMRSAGFTTIPPLTGQDAELAAIQRIVAGQQYMTVYKAIKPEATAAATAAVALLKGQKPASNIAVDNGAGQVPSQLLVPVAVTIDNIKDTLIKDGFYTRDEICTAEFVAACTEAGL
ncbi:sugar ABC transporter substrate-binding protein [Acrocarpospora macrocephala]|uniref:Solute-binding protein n=1 Tax=Acrocarpospora macrocephala TaxID=150177 RepID=A0A5M3WE12_9ACTN|nr:substrate-binding domain-containing protein [Acrocarpospora macrocephala]GES06490.1 solute-binding protein [Acrocarpospora macrocephala]